MTDIDHAQGGLHIFDFLGNAVLVEADAQLTSAVPGVASTTRLNNCNSAYLFSSMMLLLGSCVTRCPAGCWQAMICGN